MYVANEDEEGLYNLYFHNCQNYDNNKEPLLVDFTVRLSKKTIRDWTIVRHDEETFLS